MTNFSVKKEANSIHMYETRRVLTVIVKNQPSITDLHAEKHEKQGSRASQGASQSFLVQTASSTAISHRLTSFRLNSTSHK